MERRTIRVALPAFVVLVLQHRANSRGKTIADVIEAMLSNDCYLDEAQAVARESPAAERAFMEWLSFAYDVRQKARRK